MPIAPNSGRSSEHARRQHRKSPAAARAGRHALQEAACGPSPAAAAAVSSQLNNRAAHYVYLGRDLHSSTSNATEFIKRALGYSLAVAPWAMAIWDRLGRHVGLLAMYRAQGYNGHPCKRAVRRGEPTASKRHKGSRVCVETRGKNPKAENKWPASLQAIVELSGEGFEPSTFGL